VGSIPGRTVGLLASILLYGLAIAVAAAANAQPSSRLLSRALSRLATQVSVVGLRQNIESRHHNWRRR
jgi:hypothetical protein